MQSMSLEEATLSNPSKQEPYFVLANHSDHFRLMCTTTDKKK